MFTPTSASFAWNPASTPSRSSKKESSEDKAGAAAATATTADEAAAAKAMAANRGAKEHNGRGRLGLPGRCAIKHKRQARARHCHNCVCTARKAKALWPCLHNTLFVFLGAHNNMQDTTA